jgi:hypothetical protein
MSKLFVAGFLACLIIPAAAQTVRPPPANPLSTWLRGAYMNNRNTILRTAERMPEENYGMRPGPQEEVRTFGQQVGHLANYNYIVVCASQGREEPDRRHQS